MKLFLKIMSALCIFTALWDVKDMISSLYYLAGGLILLCVAYKLPKEDEDE